jgi:hypothetical protein
MSLHAKLRKGQHGEFKRPRLISPGPSQDHQGTSVHPPSGCLLCASTAVCCAHLGLLRHACPGIGEWRVALVASCACWPFCCRLCVLALLCRPLLAGLARRLGEESACLCCRAFIGVGVAGNQPIVRAVGGRRRRRAPGSPTHDHRGRLLQLRQPPLHTFLSVSAAAATTAPPPPRPPYGTPPNGTPP